MRYRFVIDTEQRRPMCAILQAALGGDYTALATMLPAESWLTAPTDHMRMLEGTREEWERFADQLRDRLREQKGGT